MAFRFEFILGKFEIFDEAEPRLDIVFTKQITPTIGMSIKLVITNENT